MTQKLTDLIQVRATFHCFKASGKWYTTAEGYLPSWANERPWSLQLDDVLHANSGYWPGLSTDGETFNRVVLPVDGVPFMWTIGNAR